MDGEREENEIKRKRSKLEKRLSIFRDVDVDKDV